MLKKIILVLIFVSFSFAKIEILGINYSQKDKKLHTTASFILATTSDAIFTKYYKYQYNKEPTKFQRFTVSFLTSFSIGILKELHDKNQENNHFDNKDLKADFIGSLIGSLCSINIRW